MYDDRGFEGKTSEGVLIFIMVGLELGMGCKKCMMGKEI